VFLLAAVVGRLCRGPAGGRWSARRLASRGRDDHLLSVAGAGGRRT